MDQNVQFVSTKHVVMRGGEYAGLICLAAIGLLCIMSNMSHNAYILGQNNKQRAMKREFKKYLKNEKKRQKREMES